MAAETSTLSYLVSGIVLGLSAGISPGPLMTLVLSETLTHGGRAGARVAMAPAITDAPIVLLSVLILGKLSNHGAVLGVIALAGALFLAYLARECLLAKGVSIEEAVKKPRSLRKGVLTNFLSPNPYLFWITVGAPMIVSAADISWNTAALFLGGFYALLIGAKIGVAALTAKFRTFMKSAVYVWTMRFLGVALAGMAVMYFLDGLAFLNVV